MNYRIGHGYDVHKLQKGRELILGGVHIENDGIGLLGHSDADILAMLLVTLYSVQLRSVISESIFPIQMKPIKMPTVWFFYLKCVICLRRTVILSEI